MTFAIELSVSKHIGQLMRYNDWITADDWLAVAWFRTVAPNRNEIRDLAPFMRLGVIDSEAVYA